MSDYETLESRFLVPPFSILDSRAARWQARKHLWHKIIKSGEGRNDDIIGAGGLKAFTQKYLPNSNLTGTSIFDPVLCEILIAWFSPFYGKILDPFAGGSVRGLMASFLCRDYVGIDLRPEQIEANESGFEEVKELQDLYGNPLRRPSWIAADSGDIEKVVDESDFDFILSSPPYYDIEDYTDDPCSLGKMPYAESVAKYADIIKQSVGKLKNDAFACFVVGEVRDKKGFYRGWVPATISAFEAAGMRFYNECIFVEACGSAPFRAARTFTASRKVVKTHQNVLVFVRGDIKRIINRLSIAIYDLSFLGGRNEGNLAVGDDIDEFFDKL